MHDTIKRSAPRIVELSSYAMLVTAILTFIALHYVAAPYGRYSPSRGKETKDSKQRAASSGWGPLIPARVAWIIMESPNLWIYALILLSISSDTGFHLSSKAVVLSLCYLGHYVNRALVFPLSLSSSTAPMPLSVMMMAFLYCTWNGVNQALFILLLPHDDINWHSPEGVRTLVGVSCFALGMFINISADRALIQLRQEKRPGEYVIPRGPLFALVSCPNYGKEKRVFLKACTSALTAFFLCRLFLQLVRCWSGVAMP